MTAKPTFWDSIDRLLEAVDVDGVVALVHRPRDVSNQAHADFF
jgi:hypothetical protein